MPALKSLGQDVGWHLMSHLVRVARDHPRARVYREIGLLAKLAGFVVSSRTGVVFGNLAKAFPEWSARRTRATADRVLRTLSRTIADILYYPFRNDELRRYCVVENQEILDDALASGRGAIIATGHIGVFPYVGLPAIWDGRPVGVVAKEPRDARLGAFLVEQCARIDLEFVGATASRATAARAALRYIKRGGVVIFLFDMHPGEGVGLEVEFLGRPTAMYNGMIKIAAKTGVPLIPGCVTRAPGDRNLVIRYRPPLAVPKAALDDETPEAHACMQQLATWLTAEIRAHPDQWWWIHRRWR